MAWVSRGRIPSTVAMGVPSPCDLISWESRARTGGGGAIAAGTRCRFGCACRPCPTRAGRPASGVAAAVDQPPARLRQVERHRGARELAVALADRVEDRAMLVEHALAALLRRRASQREREPHEAEQRLVDRREDLRVEVV